VQVAELMARGGVSFLQAIVTLELKIDPDEAEACSRRTDFQDILRSEKNKYHQMVANDPTMTKSAVMGQLWILADKLAREGEHDKSAGVLEKLAKLAGWQGGESNVNIFGGLTAKDIAEARARIAEGLPGGPGKPKTTKPETGDLVN
jgi:hypothetical protein